MERLSAYVPIDRRRALAQSRELAGRQRGAALFADISGFTQLTESLARELGPRAGVEVLGHQLNLVYHALIAQLDAYQGSVIGFAGDGMICWFEGDSGLVATACALRMQQSMLQHSTMALPSGQSVLLGLKISIASGPASRLLVGDPSIQLIEVLAGQTLERMAAAEHVALRGEVVLDGEVEALGSGAILVREWRVDQAAGAAQQTPPRRYAIVEGLREPLEPAAPPLWLDELSEQQSRPWLLPPVYEQIMRGQGAFLAELRPAAALFMRFRGIDYDHDPEAQSKLNSFVCWVQGVVDRYDGVLVQLTMGDKGSYLYVAFGAPIAHQDDLVRAGLAALELRRPPAELRDLLTLQIGLSQGIMRTGAYGGATRRTYGVFGDEVNLAARLMYSAHPGEILASPQVWQALGDHFSWAEPLMLELRGKRQPITARALLGLNQQRAQRQILPLIGRTKELATAMGALEFARAGSGQVLGLFGQAGIGKSRLIYEIASLAESRDALVLQGLCQSYSSSSYFCWRSIWQGFFALDPAWTPAHQLQVLQQTLERYDPALIERLPLLAPIFQLPIAETSLTEGLDARLRKESLESMLIDCLKLRLRASPETLLVLILEDCHWIDALSRDLLEVLGRALADLPILLLLSYRPQERDHSEPAQIFGLPFARSLALHEFSSHEASRLIEAKLTYRFGRRLVLPPDVMRRLIAQSQGNPFYLEELINYFQDQGQDLLDPQVLAQFELPTSLQRLILSRIDQLDEEARTTLKVASVIGQSFEIELLERTHPGQPAHQQLLSQVTQLEAHDFTRLATLAVRLTYVFKQNLIQEVAYDTLLETQQRQLHCAVGAALEQLQPEAVESLAYHYARAKQREKALHYLDLAARKTQRQYANEEALSYYTQALALQERWEWRLGQAEVLHLLGRREQEQQALERLAALSDASPFDLAYRWGIYYESVGSYVEAQSSAERALALASAQRSRSREVRCLALLGQIARRQGDYEQAIRWYTHALDFFHGDQEAADEIAPDLVQVLNGLGIINRQQGNFESASRYYQWALGISRRQGARRDEADVLNSIGVIAYYQRNFTEAFALHQQSFEIRRAIGDRAGEGISLYNIALALKEIGDYDPAKSYALQALEIQQQIGNRWEEINILTFFGCLWRELGDLARAQSYLERGLDLSTLIGDEEGKAYLLCNLALVYRDQEQLEQAEQLLTQGLALARNHEGKYLITTLLSELGAIALLRKRPAEAIAWSTSALELRRELELDLATTYNLSILAAAYLAMGDTAKALTYAQQTMAMLDQYSGEGTDTPHHDYFACFQVFAALDDAAGARTALEGAYHLLLARAETIADPALRSLFLAQAYPNRLILEAASAAGLSA